MPEPTSDPSTGEAAGRSRRIAIDDLGRFEETAGAFWMAVEHLSRARQPFAAAARNIPHELGDPYLSAQYARSFEQMHRILTSLERTCEQFFDALASVGRTYDRAEDSVARRMD